MPLAWTVREEALQHLCSTAQKKNCVVTQGGIWISLESLQPFAIQARSTEKKAWGCDSHPCLAADFRREEPWLGSLPLYPSHLCVQRTQQDRVGTQACCSSSQPRAYRLHTMLKGGQLRALTPEPATTAFARVHLSASCKRHKLDNTLLLPCKHENKPMCISCYRVISYQQRWATEERTLPVHFDMDLDRPSTVAGEAVLHSKLCLVEKLPKICSRGEQHIHYKKGLRKWFNFSFYFLYCCGLILS